MHQLRAISVLPLYAMQCASLVISNPARSNAISHGTPHIIQPTNIVKPQNQTGPLTWGTYYDIGSNLIVYITLGDTAPAQPFYDLLLLSKEQVHHHAALFGPTAPVPRKKHPELTQVIRAGFTYFIEPTRALVPGRPGLEWQEFDVVTSWLYEYFKAMLNHRDCTFLLFRKINVTTGQEGNLAFGEIRPLNTRIAVDTASSGTARLRYLSLSTN